MFRLIIRKNIHKTKTLCSSINLPNWICVRQTTKTGFKQKKSDPILELIDKAFIKESAFRDNRRDRKKNANRCDGKSMKSTFESIFEYTHPISCYTQKNFMRSKLNAFNKRLCAVSTVHSGQYFNIVSIFVCVCVCENCGKNEKWWIILRWYRK